MHRAVVDRHQVVLRGRSERRVLLRRPRDDVEAALLRLHAYRAHIEVLLVLLEGLLAEELLAHPPRHLQEGFLLLDRVPVPEDRDVEAVLRRPVVDERHHAANDAREPLLGLLPLRRIREPLRQGEPEPLRAREVPLRLRGLGERRDLRGLGGGEVLVEGLLLLLGELLLLLPLRDEGLLLVGRHEDALRLHEPALGDGDAEAAREELVRRRCGLLRAVRAHQEVHRLLLEAVVPQEGGDRDSLGALQVDRGEEQLVELERRDLAPLPLDGDAPRRTVLGAPLHSETLRVGLRDVRADLVGQVDPDGLRGGVPETRDQALEQGLLVGEVLERGRQLLRDLVAAALRQGLQPRADVGVAVAVPVGLGGGDLVLDVLRRDRGRRGRLGLGRGGGRRVGLPLHVRARREGRLGGGELCAEGDEGIQGRRAVAAREAVLDEETRSVRALRRLRFQRLCMDPSDLGRGGVGDLRTELQEVGGGRVDPELVLERAAEVHRAGVLVPLDEGLHGARDRLDPPPGVPLDEAPAPRGPLGGLLRERLASEAGLLVEVEVEQLSDVLGPGLLIEPLRREVGGDAGLLGGRGGVLGEMGPEGESDPDPARRGEEDEGGNEAAPASGPRGGLFDGLRDEDGTVRGTRRDDRLLGHRLGEGGGARVLDGPRFDRQDGDAGQADGDHVSDGEDDALGLLPVDLDAVAAPEVCHDPAVGCEGKLEVPAGGLLVGEANLAGGLAAGGEGA